MAKPETAIETVTMTDGRIVEFAGKRKLLKSSSLDSDGRVVVRLDFRNGDTRTFTVSDKLRDKFIAHGAEQKLGDEIAGLADIDDCVMALDELLTRLDQGEWGIERQSNGLAGQSILARALVELFGKPIDEIKTFLSGKSQAEKVALRNNPRVKPIIEKLEAAKATKGSAVDTEALLAGLEDAPNEAS